uniref:G-protein coupled receptors family 1 profile domain-containing protein n=1 Tax=Xenopus tropicalis TaxID=8364 RepID=A0A803JHT7_XENTR
MRRTRRGSVRLFSWDFRISTTSRKHFFYLGLKEQENICWAFPRISSNCLQIRKHFFYLGLKEQENICWAFPRISSKWKYFFCLGLKVTREHLLGLPKDLFQLSPDPEMSMKNQTWVSEIVLLGFQNLHNFKVPLFSLFLLIYILTVWENVLIIVLVAFSRNLHSPMYFFIQQLSLSDLLESSNIAPTLLQTVLSDGVTMPLVGCITQLYFVAYSVTFQSLLLAEMSYDRYVAICIPLRYTSIMSHAVCIKIILMSWIFSICSTLATANLIGTLKFCEQNKINHFFCDLDPLLQISCSDTFYVKIEATLMSIPVVVCPFILIIVSYMCIAHAILKIVSHTGRQKAFSTCSSHLAVVSMYYGALIAIYLAPSKKETKTISKVLSLFYTVVIPLVNPVIYSLRSKDIKEAFKKIVQH